MQVLLAESEKPVAQTEHTLFALHCRHPAMLEQATHCDELEELTVNPSLHSMQKSE